MPFKVNVVVSKVSQEGNGSPFAKVTVNSGESPSGSVTRLAKEYEKENPSLANCLGMVLSSEGAVLGTMVLKVVDVVAPLESVAFKVEIKVPWSPVVGVPNKWV